MLLFPQVGNPWLGTLLGESEGTTMRHVDLVANDWTAGTQAWLARVIAIDSDAVKVEAIDPIWEQRLNQPITLSTGEVFTPGDSSAYLDALARKYHGTHVEATNAHEDSECAFQLTERPLETSHARANVGHTIIGLVERVVPGHSRR